MSPESESGPAEVFICYSDDDKQRVTAIGEALEARGVSAWWAGKGIPGGANWQVWVSRAIRGCKVVLLMCTNSALGSTNVINEVAAAGNRKKPLIPLFVERIVERIEDLPEGWDITLGSPQAIDIAERPTDQWLPHLLDSLRIFGVAIRPSSGNASIILAGRRPGPTGPELPEMASWLRKLNAVAERLRAWSVDVRNQNEGESAFRRRIADAIDVLTRIDDELPYLHGTLVALARHEDVPDEEVAALRQLQTALVDIARAVSTGEAGVFDALPLPPYDLWLPFKGGGGKPGVLSIAQ